MTHSPPDPHAEDVARRLQLTGQNLYNTWLGSAERLGRAATSGTLNVTDPLAMRDAFNVAGWATGGKMPFAKTGTLGIGGGRLKPGPVGNVNRNMPQVVLEETTQPVQRFEAGPGRRNFRMKMGDQDLGGIAIDTRYPDQPYVDLIENYEGGGANSLGDAVVRQVLRALFQEFPEALKITGNRISGARELAGRTGVTEVPRPGSQEIVPPEEISVKQMGTHSPYSAAEYAGKPYFVARDKRGSLPGDYITANSEEDALNIARARRYRRFIER